jgi:Uma2 family endonuclease
VFTSQVALRRTDAPTYVFPDASYTYEALEPNAEFIVAPRLVVEVMSPSSVERDRGDKLDTYREIPSVMEYLIVDSRRIWACVFRRSGRHWTLTHYGSRDTIELVSVEHAPLKLVDLYGDDATSE